MLPEVVEAAHKLKESGISAKVVSFHTVKPLDEACLKDAFAASSWSQRSRSIR